MSVERPIYVVSRESVGDDWEILGIFSTEKEARDHLGTRRGNIDRYILNRPDLQAQEIE